MKRPLFVALAFLAVGCTRSPSPAVPASSPPGEPERGGTLRLLATDDLDHLSTSSAYAITTQAILWLFTRQLVTSPAAPSLEGQSQVVADLASELPTRENGGISADGLTYTFHLRRGVQWNTQPPRDVTAQDQVRGLKLMCNPVSPYGAPSYYEDTITGWKEYCSEFAKVPGTAADIRAFLDSHEVPGIRAVDATTVVLTLKAPASDFLHILTLPFSTAVPVEYLQWVPDSAEARTHTISDGPYQITSYVPNREIVLERNPAWDSAADQLRKAWVDKIVLTEGVSTESAQQQLQAGSADLFLDGGVPRAELAALLARRDPNLILGVEGEVFPDMSYLIINHKNARADAPLSKLKVRQALHYGVDRRAIVQVRGGPAVAQPLHQPVSSATSGFVRGFDPYPTPEDRGDPAKARQLLAEAGYPNGLTLRLHHAPWQSAVAQSQTIQASLAKAGVQLELVPATAVELLSTLLPNPDNARAGVWDLALSGWGPDWLGNNGRATIAPLFDGRSWGLGSVNSGGYNNDAVNDAIDHAERAPDDAEAERRWASASRLIAEDVAIVPLLNIRSVVYRASRVQGCVYRVFFGHCDLANVWLKGASAEQPTTP